MKITRDKCHEKVHGSYHIYTCEQQNCRQVTSSNNVHTYDVSNKQNDGIEFRVYVESKENSFKRQKAEHYRCIM